MKTAALDISLILLMSASYSLFTLSESFSIDVFISSKANKKK